MEKIVLSELISLVERVFGLRAEDKALAILVDLPEEASQDRPAWRERREMALVWAEDLAAEREHLGLNVHLYLYRSVGRNNGDLPKGAWVHRVGPLPERAKQLEANREEPFESIFSSHNILIALTQFSPTAPLKMAARKHGFRAASMPGFTVAMIPALRLDYQAVNRRCQRLKSLLDSAIQAHLVFRVDEREEYSLNLDLRYRQAHASGGLMTGDGEVGNLPSGEAYIVPYEGEREGEPSVSQGQLPVQFGSEVVVYQIEGNRAIHVESQGAESQREAELLGSEPAYGNLAELGVGVLSDFGIKPVGEILLDEKLGLHIAFGRSEHLGGQVGPSHFSRPEAVVHLDRVYIRETQPRVLVVAFDLLSTAGSYKPLMRNNKFVLDL